MDARRARRRAALGSVTLFALSACISYGVMSTNGGPLPAEALLAPAPSPVEVEPAPEPAAPGQPLVTAETAPVSAAPPAAEVAPEPEPATPDPLRAITGRIPPGGTVAAALRGQGVSPQVVHQIASTMLPVFSFRRAQPGDHFTLIQDDSGRVLSFEFQRGRRQLYQLDRIGGRLEPRRSEVPLERREVRLAGIIERSLYESLLALGEGADLVSAFSDIFIWDFDFSTQTRPGDEFRLVYEKYYDSEGFVRYGQVLAAQYRASGSQFTAVFFEDEDGYADYYTPAGNSVRRTFLRAPVHYSRISSRYSNSRLHPILKVRRPHHGVDYAAPTGTPVWAVADGEVTFAARNGGFGRLVKVRHNNGYVSYYGHLSRFAKDIRRGARVRQKQVIGYVGTSGLATGPHLDYRLRVGGRFVDPLKVRFPKGDPIPVGSRDRFDVVKAQRLTTLGAAAPPLVLEAAM